MPSPPSAATAPAPPDERPAAPDRALPALALDLPAGVRAVVDERRRAVAGRLRGRVLDLGTDAGRRTLVAAATTAADERGEPAEGGPIADPQRGERYDTIVSVGGLAHLPDLLAALEAVDRLLAPDGTVELVEPVDRPVLGGLVLASLGALHPSVRGLHVNRDVPKALRATSLTIVDIERIAMPTPIWPLRAFVALTAERIPTSAPSGPVTEVGA